jgi:hypothetical protein
MDINRMKAVALAINDGDRKATGALFKTGLDKKHVAATDATDEEIAYVTRWASGYAKHSSDAKAKKPAKRGKRGAAKK